MFKKAAKYFAIAGSLLALGACHHERCGHGSWFADSPEEAADFILKRAKKKMDLTEEQTAKLRIVADEILAVQKEMHQDREAKHAEISAMILSENLDTEKILAVMDEKHKLLEQKAPEVLAKVADFHASLSREQREKINRQFQKHTKCD